MKKTLLLLAFFPIVVSAALCQEADTSSPAVAQIEQANACFDNKEYSKAIPIYRKAAAKNPDNTFGALAHYKCAKTLEVLGKYNDAISECSQSIAINPFLNDAIAYLLRGALYEKTGKYEDAVCDYNKVLLINPDNETARKRRDEILFQWYVISTNEGLSALSSGLVAYKNGDNTSAVKDLDKAYSLFNNARAFYLDDKTAFGMVSFIKGLKYRMAAKNFLGTIKLDGSGSDDTPQLVNAYYDLALADAYYRKALSYLKDDGLVNPLKEEKELNDRDLVPLKSRIDKLEPGSESYTKATDLEAASIVNFDVAGDLLNAGDVDELKRILDENKSIAASLIKSNKETAEGISYLSEAYAKLSRIFSYDLTDPEWLKANKESLSSEISACSNDINRAKSAITDTALADNCSGLLQSIALLQKLAEKAGG
ncbi:MAG: tetratricopeptide repeat protein [Candidatus Omnitrophica bacterium]|nr:tetratricopeptide repeat protein [Candidatus Omnitrophota bacterium]